MSKFSRKTLSSFPYKTTMFREKMVDLVKTFNLLFISFIYLFFFLFYSATGERKKDQQPDLVSTSSQYHHGPPSSVPGMDDTEFRCRGKEMIDYIADYLLHIR
jgi:hypothetical protein